MVGRECEGAHIGGPIHGVGAIVHRLYYAAPTDPPEVDQPEAPAAAQPQERVIPVANALEPGVEVHSDLGFQTMGLDPNAVVAAQEKVLTGIYDRLVPSVVQVRTYASPPQGTGSGEAPSIPFNFGGRGGAGLFGTTRDAS